MTEVIERSGAHLIALTPEHAEDGAGLHGLHADPFDGMPYAAVPAF